jgi:hypothetical protein
MPVEVMQALVAAATEDANQARMGGELDLERELRTKARYYLVCFLIWPRPGEQRMISLLQIARGAMYVSAESGTAQAASSLVYSPGQTDQEIEDQAGRCVDRMAHPDHETGSMMMNLIQTYEKTGVDLDVSFPYCGGTRHTTRQARWSVVPLVRAAHGATSRLAAAEGRRHVTAERVKHQV